MNTYKRVIGLVRLGAITVMHSNALYMSATRPRSNQVRLYLNAPPTGEEEMLSFRIP